MGLVAGISAGTVTALVGVVGALVALVTLIKALIEYTHQGRQKRAEHFFELRRRLKENEEFARVAELIDQTYAEEDAARPAREELKDLPFQVKRDYLGLFEEIAIAMNSGLIKPQVAHYMFGYYALLCWESEEFWTDVNRLSHYWSLFADFCEQMRAERDRFEFRREDFQF
ncbi:MAG: hypothetical protein WD810_05800 [Solirubrobacterales bacterium]